MNGNYLASQLKGLAGPIIAFREYAIRDVLPAFGNIDKRAQQVEDDCYNRIGSQLTGDGIDMGDVADSAQEHSYDWWEMMTSLRQTMLNLMAAGLFHLIEQQLGAITHDGIFRKPRYRLTDTKLSVVVEWYLEHLKIDITTLPSWSSIDEMRLVANAVKHAQGSATRQLRAPRPELFSNPAYGSDAEDLAPPVVSAPLSGEDFFVTEEILQAYAERAESFFEEIAAHLSRG